MLPPANAFIKAQAHEHPHAFGFFNGRLRDGLGVYSRRSWLKASMAGLAGLSLPGLLEARRSAAAEGRSLTGQKSVILLWMTGGPSRIDTWDVKPDAPLEIRGPFKNIPTRLPGVHLCEHYPKQAAMLDKFTLIRSVDARFSNHEPNQVFQTGNLEAEPRLNAKGGLYPAMGSIVAQWHGARHPQLPPYVALNVKSHSHIAWGGYLGKSFDPFPGTQAQKLFQVPGFLTLDRLQNRRELAQSMGQLRGALDLAGSMEGWDRFQQQAFDLIVGRRAQEAFDVTREPEKVRDRYGAHDWCKQALLARRLVEAGVSFVTIDLSNHSASGTWDTHGDNIPPYGGIMSGLKPLLPIFDHLITTLVSDLEERGLLEDVLVIAMGEFGRTPQIGTQGSTDGRDHWPVVMSMLLAGGGFRHGQVIGATEKDGGQIKERPVTPGDLAATIYHHFQIPLDATYNDHQGRPRYIVENGTPLRELV